MDYLQACLHAQLKSAENKCTIRVCAVLGMVGDTPAIVSYILLDWFDGSVVCNYTEGKRHG